MIGSIIALLRLFVVMDTLLNYPCLAELKIRGAFSLFVLTNRAKSDKILLQRKGGAMDKYKQLLIAVSERPHLVLFLKLVDIFAVVATVCTFVAMLVMLGLSDLYLAVRLAFVCGAPYVLVSLVRGLIDAPRPYEVYNDIYTVPPKKREGASFPSRHAFSVFSIGTALLFVYPSAAADILVLGIFLSVSRVLLGKHFLRDIVAGGVLGIMTSLVGMLILYF